MKFWILHYWDLLLLEIKGRQLRKDLDMPLTLEEKAERMEMLRDRYRREEEYEGD